MSSSSFMLPTGTVTFLVCAVAVPHASDRAQVDALLDAAIEAHSGRRSVDVQGDSLCVAAFARASDALRAASAALRSLVDASPTNESPSVCAAVHTGEAVASDGGSYLGQPVTRATRLCAIAHGGQVLVSNAARDLAVDQLGAEIELVDLGEHRLKDLARPERVWQLIVDGLPASFPEVRSLDRVPNNLPSTPTAFIGRAAELRELADLLADNALVTLVGTGGAGKTRLALRAGAEVADRFADGVRWVELATVGDPALVASAVGQVLDSPMDPMAPVESVRAALADRCQLVILDNCEHVVEAAAEIAAMVTDLAPASRVLATSRSPLGVPGEVAWRVPPMALPAPGHDDPITVVSQYDAVRLFLQRARQARRNFHLTDENAPAVAELCARLDGVPLAIELAAARCKLLTPDRILEAMADASSLLRGSSRGVVPRQRTIDASVAWSYGLLDESEQLLLRRLAVFAGPFSLDAAESVAGDEPLSSHRVLQSLERLVDHSLVDFDDARADAEFRLLETIRQFAEVRLQDEAEADRVRARHADHFRARALGLWPLYTSAMADKARRAEREHADLVVMLAHLAEHGSNDELAEVATACLPAMAITRPMEADRWFALVADRLAPDAGPPLAWLLLRWLEPLTSLGAGDRVVDLLRRAQAIGEASGDEAILASAGFSFALIGIMADPAGGQQALVDAGERCRRAGNEHFADVVTRRVAWAKFNAGDLAGALAGFENAAANEDECLRCRSARMQFESVVHLAMGDLDGATRLSVDSLQLSDLLHDVPGRAWGLMVLTQVASFRDEPDAAAREEGRRLSERARQLRLRAARALLVTAEAHAAMASDPGTVVDLLDDRVRRVGPASSPVVFPNVVLLAAAQHALGDVARAEELLDLADHLNARLDRPINRAQVALRRGWLAVDRGEAHAAEEQGQTALDVASTDGWMLEQVDALELLAAVAAMAESWHEAAVLDAAADGIRAQLGYLRRHDPERRLREELFERCRSAMGADAFERARMQGAGIEREELIGAVRRMRGERGRPSIGWDALTPTEARVCALVGEGLTNKEVGARLLMGAETVKTHLSRAFRKLGIRNRAQLAAELARRNQRDD